MVKNVYYFHVKALDHVCNSCKKWKLEVNSIKTTASICGCRKAENSSFQFICNGLDLGIVYCLNMWAS